jgi:putative heme-binding domain-containing protein
VAAVGLLAYAPFDLASRALSRLLTPQTPPALQSAALGALAAQTQPEVGKQLLAGWRTFGPKVRRDCVDALLVNASRLGDLLDAVERGEVGRGEIDRDVKQLLMNHRQSAIARRARGLFEADLPGDRTQVVAAYQPALRAAGSADRGRGVFLKRCSTCHRVGSEGHAVGPDLASTLNKSPADLLMAILDPNREAQPNFVSYTLVTTEGLIHNGIIAAESSASVTLRRAEGKEDQVLRAQIEELVSSGKSLMPEGLEKDIAPAEMADLLAYLKSIGPAAASK